ncbi:uncharacterized protein LOC142642001 isoform X2 [Castanea sativa]|uniref:uncharacterized protein LOC142642001 isoform X2 n=1 Tax=Castanea sativa TaxID=21020 RepID=UPI003F64D71D
MVQCSSSEMGSFSDHINMRLLEPIKEQFPTLSYADFYQLYIKKHRHGICIMYAFLSCFSLKKNKQKPQYQEAIILASETSSRDRPQVTLEE